MMLTSGSDFAEAMGRLQREGRYDPKLLELIRPFRMEEGATVVRNLAVSELRAGMILDQDLHARSGVLLATKGWEITPPLIQRLRGFAETSGLDEPIRVLCAASTDDIAPLEWLDAAPQYQAR